MIYTQARSITQYYEIRDHHRLVENNFIHAYLYAYVASLLASQSAVLRQALKFATGRAIQQGVPAQISAQTMQRDAVLRQICS